MIVKKNPRRTATAADRERRRMADNSSSSKIIP
jgi:hypothetical protein